MLKDDIGSWLRAARKSAQLTQEEAAAKAAMSKNQWSRIEKGSGTKASTIQKMLKALGVSEAEATQAMSLANIPALVETTVPPDQPVSALQCYDEALRALDNDDVLTAETKLRRAFELDPQQQLYARKLMVLLGNQNKKSEAEQVYDNLVSLLDVGKSPDSITRRIFRAIQTEDIEKGDPSRVGRQADLDNIASAFAETHLVTVTGREGIGKTRLAALAVKDLGLQYRDGAVFVPLQTFRRMGWASSDTTLQEPVALAVLFCLRVPAPSGKPLVSALADALRDSSKVIVLDGCDTWEPECRGLINALLGRCEHIRFLVTSRHPLGMGLEEKVYSLPPLALPETETGRSLETLDSNSAIRLFRLRAQASLGDFEVTLEKGSLIESICRKVNGLPQYINWAASLLQSSDLADLEQVEKEMRPPEPQEWYDWRTQAASDSELELLSSLTIFPTDWLLTEAKFVFSSSYRNRHLIEVDVAQLQARFLARRLRETRSVTVDIEGKIQEPLWRLWEPLYDLANANLPEATKKMLRGRMVQWCIKVSDRADIYNEKKNVEERYDELEESLSYFRAALSWAMAEPSLLEAGLQLTGQLWGFWNVRGYWTEGRYWLTRVLEQARKVETLPPKLLLRAANGAGILAIRQEEYKTAQTYLWHALEYARQYENGSVKNKFGRKGCKQRWNDLLAVGADGVQYNRLMETFREEAAIYNSLAYNSYERHERDGKRLYLRRARKLYQAALSLYNGPDQDRPEVWDAKWPWHGMGNIALAEAERSSLQETEEKLSEAQEAYTRSLKIAELHDDKDGQAQARGQLAKVHTMRGDYNQALSDLKQSIADFQTLGNKSALAGQIDQLAELLKNQRRSKDAIQLRASAYKIRRESGEAIPDGGLDQIRFTEDWKDALGKTTQEIVDLTQRVMPFS